MVSAVRDTNVYVLEASDVSIKQQEHSGVQIAFRGGLDLPVLQLLPDSWPGYSRWSVFVFLGSELRESSASDEGWGDM